jgi:AsmA protein
MSKPLKFGMIGAGAILLILILIPFLIPAGAYRARIEQAAFEQTGRVLKIGGPLHVTLFPALGVRAEDVSLANVPGGHAATFASMRELRVAVRLWPLLGGRIEVSEIVLERPVVNLERDNSGHGNWTFRTGSGSHFATRFSGIRLNNAEVSYRGSDGKVRRFERAEITIGLITVDKPVMLDGEGLYRGRRVAVEARLASLTPLKAEAVRGVEVSLTSDLLQAGFKGDVSAEGDMTGALKLDTTNLPGLAEWLGENLPRQAGMKAVSLESKIETKGMLVSLPDESLRLDAMTITGHLAVNLAGRRPNVTGDVVVDRLDLNRYLDAGHPPGPATPATSGWSTAPIDLALLHLLDADLSIDAGALRVRGLHLSKSHIVAHLADSMLDVALDPMSLYGGTGRAHLVVDAKSALPKFRNELVFTNISMRALLNDAIDVQRIAGRGTVALNVVSEGTNANAIIRNLAGKGSLAVANGEITGVDLGAVARLVRTALTAEATGDQTATPFDKLTASFAIAHGVLATKDLRVDGKVLRATATGTIDLGNRTLDFMIKPKAVLLPLGTGLGVGFPFHAHGTWRAIVYTPDVTGAVTGLVSDVFNGALAVPGAVGSLFTGQDKQKPQSDNKSSKKKKSSGLFDGLFGH